MNYIVIDLIILAVLLIFALRGMRRGLIVSLCSLIAVLVAFVGATLISNALTPPVSDWLEPKLQPSIESAVQSVLPEGGANMELPMDGVLQAVEDAELSEGLKDLLVGLLEEMPALNVETLTRDMAGAVAEKAANIITYVVLFLLAFVVILLVWKLLYRTLDLVTRLPVLHAANKLGGFAFGAVYGALLLFLCAWVVHWLGNGMIPADVIEQTRLLQFFMTVNPLDYLAKL